jgi:replicative DNA helicase
MKRRGIPVEIAERYGLGFAEEWRHPKFSNNYPVSPRVIIPTSPSHYTARDIRDKSAMTDLEQSKAKMKVGTDAPIFNAAAIKSATKPIFITEGEIDALSLITMGAEAVALGSTSNVQKLADHLKRENASQPLIIAMDNDSGPGTGAAAKIKAALDLLGIMHTIADTAALYGGEKDANDALTKLEDWRFSANILEAERDAEQLRDVAAAAELSAHRQTSAAHHIDKLLDIINTSANTPPTSTGFKALDDILDGGLYEGLYILGAISSLGKTTLVMQMADQIARAGRDVLIFSLEMARTELMAKSISRHTFTISEDKARALSTRGITDGRRYDTYPSDRRALIKTAIEEYRKTAERVFIHEGVGDMDAERIRQTIETHVRITGAPPVVVVDYLQIITPHSDRASDKQATDKAVLELKRMGRDFKIPIIAISSFNRENYTASVNMAAFKESGAVEYSADVLMGLQLEGMDTLKSEDKQSQIDDLKSRDPRRVELKILKNRNGPIGGKVAFDFYAPFNYFRGG